LLSKQSQLDAVDLDANAQAAVEFFQGNVLEFERRSYPSGQTMHLGEVTERYVQPRYIVTTDIGVYRVFFEVYSVYKEKPDEVGLRYIQIVSEGSEYERTAEPGIHVGP
jgi:hypothetical protein